MSSFKFPKRGKYMEALKTKVGKNVPHLEINEEVLVVCNIVNDDYQNDSRHGFE